MIALRQTILARRRRLNTFGVTRTPAGSPSAPTRAGRGRWPRSSRRSAASSSTGAPQCVHALVADQRVVPIRTDQGVRAAPTCQDVVAAAALDRGSGRSVDRRGVALIMKVDRDQRDSAIRTRDGVIADARAAGT